MLELNDSSCDNTMQIGIDEAGRGPLLGRVYAAACLLPQNSELLRYSDIKDSKKFSSRDKIKEVATNIKENAIAWSVHYEDEKTVDRINILQATYAAMYKCTHDMICKLKNKFSSVDYNSIILLIDGRYFTPTSHFIDGDIVSLSYKCIEKGDGKFMNIAAASILAKVARDDYVESLCDQFPLLDQIYRLRSNKGYGSKHHCEAIREHGISQFHRQTFGICRNKPITFFQCHSSHTTDLKDN